MANNSDGTVKAEVENRLQALFFGDVGESPAAAKDIGEPVPDSHIEELKGYAKDKEKRNADEDSLLEELGAIVLSLDWEISDEIVDHLLEKIAGLKHTYKNDKNNLFFIQMLDSVGKYIKANKVESHPDSIKVLNSVYAGLARAVLSKGMTEAAKKKILLAQVTEFKRLKEQIALTKGGAAKKQPFPDSDKPPTGEKKSAAGLQKENAPEVETVREGGGNMSRMLPHEAFVFAVEELREVIKAEFKVLRTELKLWREDSSSQ